MRGHWLIAASIILVSTTLPAQDRRPTTKAPSTPPATGRISSAPATPPPASARPSATASPGVPGRSNTPLRSAPPAAGPANNQDLASYAIGYDLAIRLKTEAGELNLEMLIQGIRDSFSSAEPRYPEQQLQAAAEAFDREMQARAEVRFKQLSEKNKKEGAAFLAQNKLKKTVRTLPSGVQYEVLKSGNGPSPKPTDTIRAHYKGTLIDGTVFDMTDASQPIQIEVQGTIAGWVQTLPQMRAGDKWRLYIPPELAYGEQGYGPVPPAATLIFELELLEIVPAASQQSARPRQIK